MTLSDVGNRLPVEARILGGRGSPWVEGTAQAWTRDAVMIWWADTDHLSRIDLLPDCDGGAGRLP